MQVRRAAAHPLERLVEGLAERRERRGAHAVAEDRLHKVLAALHLLRQLGLELAHRGAERGALHVLQAERDAAAEDEAAVARAADALHLLRALQHTNTALRASAALRASPGHASVTGCWCIKQPALQHAHRCAAMPGVACMCSAWHAEASAREAHLVDALQRLYQAPAATPYTCSALPSHCTR